MAEPLTPQNESTLDQNAESGPRAADRIRIKRRGAKRGRERTYGKYFTRERKRRAIFQEKPPFFPWNRPRPPRAYLCRFNFPKEGEGGGRLFLERFAARYTERVKEEKPWWPKSFMGFNQANERSVCRDAGSFALMKSLLSPPCLILRQLVLFRVRSPSVNRDGHRWPSP